MKFQSTHPLRGATKFMPTKLPNISISIHAPLAGCDPSFGTKAACHCHFNPRTPCGVRPKRPKNFVSGENFNPRTPCGVRHGKFSRQNLGVSFQSTHPLRGATGRTLFVLVFRQHFNPRTPCGVRPVPVSFEKPWASFQSTHPLRGATDNKLYLREQLGISIHAPLAGCDRYHYTASLSPCHFNPRTPCGVRPLSRGCWILRLGFQSTHPLRGATTRFPQ